MTRAHFYYLVAFSNVVLATPLIASNNIAARASPFSWGPCQNTSTTPTAPIVCSNFTVPLDYSDPKSTETLTLELIKIPALRGPSQGTIFLNYGGPGSNGQLESRAFGLYQQAVTGGMYDLINIVPRGTGPTFPFSCYNSTQSQGAAVTQGLLSTIGRSSDVARGIEWAGSTIYAANCFEAGQEAGSLIGTAFVARDIVQVADALGEQSIRYWGISYGSVLGQALAQLFPDRMERVVFDGVQNTPEYYSNTGTQVVSSDDAVFAIFCQYCAAAPDKCLMAQGNLTAEQISDIIFVTLEEVRQNPIAIVLPGSGTLVDYSLVRFTIVQDLYGPNLWPGLDAFLYAVYTRNSTTLLQVLSASTGSGSEQEATAADALRGIRCGDVYARASKLSEASPVLDARYNISKIGGDWFDGNTMICAQWQMDAKERVIPIINDNIETKNPVLLLSNRYDPVTPLISARNTSSRFEGSVVLESNQVGHASLSQGSTCQAKITQAYFVNGTLPDPNTICEVDLPGFSNQTGLDIVIKNLGFAN